MKDMKVSLYRHRELAIEWREPASLKRSPNNPRQHSKDQIHKLRCSLREFGFTNPILVDDQGVVLCGHGRLEASIAEGIAKVPVIQISHLDEAQRRAYVIADNALAEKAGWSQELLRSELGGLIELGFDLELTGFDTVEIDSLLSFDDTGTDGGAAEDEEAVELPDEREPLSRLGDHWIIGRHHLLVADARDPESYAQRLPLITAPVSRIRKGKEIKLVISDSTGAERDETLVSLLREALAIREEVLSEPEMTIAENAASSGRCRKRMTRLFRLSWIAPEIVDAILAGEQLHAVTTRSLLTADLPLDWSDQKAALGF